MAEVLNTEVRKKVDAVVEMFEGELFPKMKSGMENATECATKAGSDKLIASCKAAEEGTQAMIVVFQSLVECCKTYNEQLKKLENAL